MISYLSCKYDFGKEVDHLAQPLQVNSVHLAAVTIKQGPAINNHISQFLQEIVKLDDKNSKSITGTDNGLK